MQGLGRQTVGRFFFFFLFSTLSKHLVWHLFSQFCRPYHGQHGILSMLSLPFLFCLSLLVTWPLCPISGRVRERVSNTLSVAQTAGVWSKEPEVGEVWVWPEAKTLNHTEPWLIREMTVIILTYANCGSRHLSFHRPQRNAGPAVLPEYSLADAEEGLQHRWCQVWREPARRATFATAQPQTWSNNPLTWTKPSGFCNQ